MSFTQLYKFYLHQNNSYNLKKRFGSADCLQRNKYIVYIVSQSADPNLFRGTAGMCEKKFNKKTNIKDTPHLLCTWEKMLLANRLDLCPF